MKFRDQYLEASDIEEIKKELLQFNNQKVVLYNENITFQDNKILFEKGSKVNVNNIECSVAYLIYNDMMKRFEFCDDFSYIVFTIDATDKRLLIDRAQKNKTPIYTITTENIHKDVDNLEYPKFSTEVHPEGDKYIGTVYAEFSPLTEKEKYIIESFDSDTLDGVNSYLSVFIQMAKKSLTFNSLGLSVGSTVIFKDPINFKFKEVYMLYELSDYYVVLMGNQDCIKYKYSDIISSASEFNTILDKNMLFYNANDGFINFNIENEEDKNLIMNEIASFDHLDLAYNDQYNQMYEFLNNTVIDNTDDIKDDWDKKLMVYLSVYTKLSEMTLFKNFSGLVLVDNNNNICMFYNLDGYKFMIDQITKILEL